MAKNILAQNESDNREKVVILITDGNPTTGSSNRNEITQSAPKAITNARDIKNMGVKLYTVGVESNADADAPFTSSSDGISGSNYNVTFDFNRFLHLVSSNYPTASSMSRHGEKTNDGFYMPVTDTEVLSEIFTKILVSTVYQKFVFTRCDIVDTLTDDFVLTMEQEQKLRDDLEELYNIADRDISVQRNADGTTTIRVSGVPAVKTTEDGKTIYRASITFDASLRATEKGEYETNTDDAYVEIDGEKIEGFDIPLPVEVETDRNIVVFTINGQIYRIDEGKLGDAVVAPVTDLAQWDIGEGTVIEGSYAEFEATAVDSTRYTVTWNIDGEKTTETYVFGEEIRIPAVADKGDLVFAGFSPAVPKLMPNRNLVFTAVYAPRHEHFFKQTGVSGSCEDGLILISTCACGETKEEKQPPCSHRFHAVIDRVSDNRIIDSLVCETCGASEGHTLTFKTQTTVGRKTVVMDLTLEKDGVKIQPAEGSSIKIMVPWENQGYRNTRVTVKRVNEDGVQRTYTATVEDGYLVFYADHFSVYIIEELDENNTSYEPMDYGQALCTLNGGHQFAVTETVPAGCESDGHRTETCTVCGEERTEVLPAAGHSDADGDHVCDSCGAVLEGHPDRCPYCGQIHTGLSLRWKTINSPLCLIAKGAVWLGWRDLNPRMTESKSVALPLGYIPMSV